MEDNKLRILTEFNSSPGILRMGTTVDNVSVVANTIRVIPGVGAPFLMFASLPNGMPDAVYFSMYPQYVVSASQQDNINMINAMLADPPTDALVYSE